MFEATQLDVKYAKAWARLGTASQVGSAVQNIGHVSYFLQYMSMWEQSMTAWRNALACLPRDESRCTATELKLKQQFLEGLKSAEKGEQEAGDTLRSHAQSQYPSAAITAEKEMPWHKAISMLENVDKDSSVSDARIVWTNTHKLYLLQAWVIADAYKVQTLL